MLETQGHFRQAIEIGRGLGDIKFGMSLEEVRQRLGAPDEIETFDETESVVLWYYSNHKLQIIFLTSARGPGSPVDEPRRVNQLTTSHPDVILWDRRIIGQNEDEVLNLFRANGYDGFVREEEPVRSLKYTSYRLDKSRMTLEFRDGLLRFILWGTKTL
jgi:hypothetical protein